MLVKSINSQSFGTSQAYKDVLSGKSSFYSLATDEKIDVIYDKLNSLEKDHKGLSENQIKMNNFNKHAFDTIAAGSSASSRIAKVTLEDINYLYNRNKLDTVG